MTDFLTISGLDFRIYLIQFYNHNIPNINKASMYKDIKQAYYGGIPEVYRPYGGRKFTLTLRCKFIISFCCFTKNEYAWFILY